MEIGVYTFGELAPDPATGRTNPEQRLLDLVEEIVLADQVGLDVFGVGVHHRPDVAVSAPAVVLAAAAARTNRIRLTSAVSVISSDDPVRVFQESATLDLLPGGRAEIMAGHGSFVESSPLFGFDLRAHNELMRSIELLGTEVAPAVRQALVRGGTRHGD
jgi:alkanesulfonate monooxygenase SsuD/methylene tetrahydromethanopterin reductase-like flavin-dependent oxidoreductase (luciferase family)